jgi:hypothetical protein
MICKQHIIYNDGIGLLLVESHAIVIFASIITFPLDVLKRRNATFFINEKCISNKYTTLSVLHFRDDMFAEGV